MTLTAPNCPAADFIMEDIRQKVESVEGVNSATINLVFEPVVLLQADYYHKMIRD